MKNAQPVGDGKLRAAQCEASHPDVRAREQALDGSEVAPAMNSFVKGDLVLLTDSDFE